MPQMQDDAGNIWEVDAQGNPVGLVRAASAQQQGRVFTLPQSPKEAKADARQASRDAQTDADRAADNARADRQLEIAERKASASADVTGTTAKIRADAIAAYQAGEAIKQRVGEMRRLFGEGPGATSGPAGILDYLPNEANKAFDQAGNAVRGHVGTALGFTGGQLNSVAEAQMAVGPYLPNSGDFDGNAVNKMDRLLDVANESQKRAIAVLGGVPDASGKISPLGEAASQRADSETDPAKLAALGTATDPSSPPPDNSPPGLPPANSQTQDTTPIGIASGSTRTVPNERANGLINSLMNAGASKSMIDTVLAKQGLPPVRSQDYMAAKAWMAKNPGQRYNAANATDLVPMSMMEQAAGSTAGSVAASWADGATAGISTRLAGEEGRGAMDAMRETYPNATTAGMLGGAIVGAGGLELGAAKMLAPKFAGWAPRIGDGLYGATQGATSADDGGALTGAAMGAGVGMLGGALGQRAMKGIGSTMRGITDPNVNYLHSRGVPLTVGQAVGNSGRLGQIIKGMEDSGTSIPIAGKMIEARRMEGLDGFNRAAFNDGAAPGVQITANGAAGMGQIRQGVGDAYDNALGGVRIDANDPDLIMDVGRARAAADAIPDVQPTDPRAFANAALRNRIEGAIDPATDEISGRGFQEAYRGLGRSGRERTNSDYGYEIGQVTRQGQDALGEALERQNPGAFSDFIEANAANRRANVLAAAVDAGKNQTDELFTPAQLNRVDSSSAGRLTGKIDAASGNRPFYDLARAGQDVLPSQMPDSGTAGRLAIMGALGLGATGSAGYAVDGGSGAATGAGLGLGATLAMALGGSKGAQSLAVRALLDRPDFAVRIGKQIEDASRFGGWLGAGAGGTLISGN